MGDPRKTMRRRIMIVDDSRMIRRRLEELIEEVPDFALVGVADSVSSALERIDLLRPDGVVLDIRLADGSGMDVLAHVKHMRPAPAVVVLTSSPKEEVRRACAALGAEAFLDKAREFHGVGPALLNAFATRPGEPAVP